MDVIDGDPLEGVVDRLKLLYRAGSDSQLARMLEVGQTTVSNWRSRKSVPLDICIRASREKKTSLDYILLGDDSTSIGVNGRPAKIDTELLGICASQLSELIRLGAPIRSKPEWLLTAEIYNKICLYIEANPKNVTDRDSILKLAKDIGQIWLLLPGEIFE